MPSTELVSPVSVQTLLCGEADRDAIVETMARQLPSEGLVAGQVRRRLDLTRLTYRLLDSRILEVAARCLDQDVGKPFAEWLAKYQNLREAAAKTVTGPSDDEVVTLTDAHPFTSTQRSEVSLYVRDEKVATIGFELALKLELGGIAVAVRHAAIEEVRCSVLKASATFTLDGYPKPLWKPEPVALPEVHVAIRPPVGVPYIPVPRAGEPPALQRTTQRPPVPLGKRSRGEGVAPPRR
jgi:hypothetical protein